MQTFIFEVGKNGAGGGVQNSQAGLFGDVFESAIAAIAIEAIGQAGRLADVKIVKAVVVKIACRDAIVAVDVDVGSAVEDGAPVIDSEK